MQQAVAKERKKEWRNEGRICEPSSRLKGKKMGRKEGRKEQRRPISDEGEAEVEVERGP